MRVSFLPMMLSLLCHAAYAQNDKPVTTGEIVALLKEGISESVIIDKIRADGCDCDRSAFGIMILKGADASDELIGAVINAPKTSSPSSATGRQRPPVRTQSSFEPRGFVFGGFTYARDDAAELNWYGGHGQVGAFLTDWLSVVGDVSYHTANVDLLGVNLFDVNALSFTVGPQFGNRYGKARGFGHVLFGGTRLSVSDFGRVLPGGSTTEFSTVVGGGVDLNLTDHFGIRVVEADWLRIWQGDGINWVRLSFGVVGRF